MLKAKAKKILMRVAKHINEEPKRLVMSTWRIDKCNDSDKIWDANARFVKSYNFPPCGTAACIAGWVVALNPKAVNKLRDVYGIQEKAEKILGVEYLDLNDLFHVGHWDEPFSYKYEIAKTVRQKANVAVSYIKHYIKTRGTPDKKSKKPLDM